MKPVSFKKQQGVLGAPLDWDEARDGKCEGLPFVRAHGCIYSVWKPDSWRERIGLLLGKPVTLVVHQYAQPPVSIMVGEP